MNIHSASNLPLAAVNRVPRNGFTGARVLVVGDIMLDRYIFGDVSRISPEAPVPVLAVKNQRAVAGGAGNVALNIAGLKAQPWLAGVVGEDSPADQLTGILQEHGVDTKVIVTEAGRPTTCKTRIMCGNHQIVRMDDESAAPLKPGTLERLLAAVVSVLEENCQAVILSDYAKGVLGANFTRSVIQACVARSIPVLVDPKRTDYSPYAGATCITPNLKEFKQAVLPFAREDQDFSSLGLELLARLQSKTLLVTQGADGMTLFSGGHSYHLPALAEEVFDVSGAGDTVISTVATALASGLDMLTAVQLSNIAASLVVRKAGTAPVAWDDLSEIVFRGYTRFEPGSQTEVPEEPRISAQ